VPVRVVAEADKVEISVVEADSKSDPFLPIQYDMNRSLFLCYINTSSFRPAVQFPLISVAKIPTLLLLLISVPAEIISPLLSVILFSLQFQPSTALLSYADT
jgi:hypothetical protein